MGENIILWTRQVSQVWEQLCKEGKYQVKEEYIRIKNGSMSDYYLELYRWYTQTAKKYITLNEENRYPIWFSLDGQARLQPLENTVILKVRMPREKVLLCNMEAWDLRVNYWYVPENKEDAQKHQKELERYGINSDDQLIQGEKGNFYPLLKNKIKNSWERVFTLVDLPPEKLVATAWELKKEWIEEVYWGEKAETVDLTK